MRDYLEQREKVLEARIAGLEALLCDARSAIAAEREACARVAETGTDFALPRMAEFQRSIARAIRSRVTV